MATEAATPASATAPAPTAQLVGNVFVEQYYLILHKSPELVFRFYTDSSVLSRPGPDGVMSSVTTMQAINEKILSLDYTNYKAEIKTADAEFSYQDGVVVLVTGCLTGKDDVKRKFTQSFFLAPQDKGYFVLNDIFRYVDESDSVESNSVLVNGAPESVQSTPVTPDPEPSHVPDHPMENNTTSIAEVPTSNGEVVHEPSETDDGSVVEDEAPPVPVISAQNEVHAIIESVSTVQEDTPKKSYASILKLMKEAKPSAVYVPTTAARSSTNAGKIPTNTGKVVSAVTEQQAVGTAAPDASATSTNNASESTTHPDEVEGYSIYIRSLAQNATVQQVEQEFKKFGPIRPNGVQVRSNKGFCFGFVEFEMLSSMQSALEASSVTIGDRQIQVEEKKTTTRVGSGGRGRFASRGGFRNEIFRSRGNFGGGRGYGRKEYGSQRNDYGNRVDFSGRRGPSGRSGEGYQRVENGNVRVGRGMNPAAVSV